MKPPVWTEPRLRVLGVLAAADGPVWAMDVARTLGIPYGTVYHSLRILYDLGWAVGDTVPSPRGSGRPARVLYRLTAQGRAGAKSLIVENERKSK